MAQMGITLGGTVSTSDSDDSFPKNSREENILVKHATSIMQISPSSLDQIKFLDVKEKWLLKYLENNNKAIPKKDRCNQYNYN